MAADLHSVITKGRLPTGTPLGALSLIISRGLLDFADAASALRGLQLIRTRIYDHFADTFSMAGVTVRYQGDGHDPPNNTPWVRVSVLPGARFRRGMGPSALRTRTTVAYVEVYYPLSYASSTNTALDADEIAQAVEDVFEGTTVADLTLYTPRTQALPNDGPWHRLNITLDVAHHDHPST